ncbi:MAG: hypothetical protein K2X43_10295 [Hyphomonadaceae bacterium]|jgi:hypothetical protein|nr:hypothetical protein [Hyphomonadaceae bacterium]
MSKNRSNNAGGSAPEIAIDLWQQMLERARSNEWSTFDKSEPPTEQEREAAQRAFREAGWTDEEIAAHEEMDRKRLSSVPTTSEGVARTTEFGLEHLRSAIAAALPDFDSDKVFFAVEPKAGPFISTVNVPMTDETIITVGTHFTRYCGLIARAYIRTINLNIFGVGVDFDEAGLRRRLRQNPDLLLYWWHIFISYALTGTHILTPFKPSTRGEWAPMEQMAFAMEIFALAHEYGHHRLRHGRGIADEAQAKQEEFEADLFALKACERVEAAERYRWFAALELPNPYLSTGAGGVLLLGSLEMFRKVKDKLFKNRRFDSHPNYAQRTSKIKNRSMLEPAKHASALDFIASAENILRCVQLELAPMMESFPYDRLVDGLPGDWEVAQMATDSYRGSR